MIFTEKSFRIFLCIGSGGVALLFWAFSFLVFINNFSLEPLAKAQVYRWDVEQVRSDRYALHASYTYQWKGAKYSGETLFQPVYLNEISAIAGLKEAASKSWTLWLNPSRPACSSLEKTFPGNLLARAAVATLVFSYFLFAYINKYFKS